ncbi:conserved hypothetical protein [Leishmania major strain Friedlin]|uniref:Uncharacterized protein P883.19 n=1 Tax=Leishmania major TaxID=5664 RepID=Q9BHF1_LEIMA|nr:conserved hypothetical protein [Leishmania major strain Friedlin]CAC37216.1 hypothetical protein P883.19 [Leishmania major]CAG9579215.1 Ribosomal_protein_L7Ae/L30e/S12e/Gadd45_family_-_putative [Leishmania major strain Friedlin]CAJ08248.1 conserved hypothetical protein [Leishmania major strain Friedlin]|eukprot:XP_001685046.1 conserved hypothetical protein [Leishmania major strain Friedlin]
MPRPERASLERSRQQEHLINKKTMKAPPLTSTPATAQPLQTYCSLLHKVSMSQPRHTAARNGGKVHQLRIKNKKSNPNAVTPFNHRARFTKLKRGIHAQRQWVLDCLPTAEPHISAGAVLQPEHSETSPVLSSPSSSTKEWASDRENGDPSADVGTRRECRYSQAAVKRTVAAMDALYASLDAAMKSHRYRQAGKLKRRIHACQLRLRRELKARALHGSLRSDTGRSSRALSDTTGTDVQETRTAVSSGDAALPSLYRSFHPPSTWLGMGQHPRSAWVDQRTGRYPQLCTEAHLQAVVRHFMNGDVADLETLPDACKAMIPAPSSSPPSTALSRSQRAMKSSLFAAAYCTNVLTDALDDLCFTLLQGLYKEQRDLKQKQPLQFKARQRYVVGFQEVLKCLKAGRVRLVLLATDVEAVEIPVSALPPPPPPPPQPSVTVPGVRRTASPSARPASKSTRKKAFQTLHEAVQLVQQLCGVTGPAERDTVARFNGHGTRAPPLCVSCMSRQRLSYALYAKGSKVGCVAVLQAEKNREALKAVMSYARYLTTAYTAEMETTMVAER